MKVIDLTLTISENIPTFPGSPQPNFISWESIEKDGYNLELLADQKDVELEIHGVYGVYDIVVKLSSDNSEKLRSIVTNDIRKIENVQSTLTMMVIEQQEKS